MAWLEARLTVHLDKAAHGIVAGNQLPRHPTGEYPVGRNTAAHRFDPNPNRIESRPFSLKLRSYPEIAPQPSCLPQGPIALTLTGAAIFSALDERGRDAAAYEVQDLCNRHPDQSGTYQYHSDSPCLQQAAKGDGGLVGFALDGFPIYASQENGRAFANEDLDECHGHIGEVGLDGESRQTYHYHLTWEFPYALGCFKGAAPAGAREPRRGLFPGLAAFCNSSTVFRSIACSQ